MGWSECSWVCKFAINVGEFTKVGVNSARLCEFPRVKVNAGANSARLGEFTTVGVDSLGLR